MHSENLITMKKSLIALAFGTLGLGIAEFVMMGILPDVAKALNISIATAGHLISAYAIGVCVGAPLLIIARKYPLKNILLVLVSMIMLGNIIAASAPNYWILMLGRFISGLPHGAYFGVGSIVAEKLADKGKGSEAVSIMIAGMTVANLFGVPLGTSLSAAISWRMTFLLVGVWGVLMVVGNLVSGRLSDRFTPGRVAAFTQGSLSILLLLIYFLASISWLSVILMCLCTAGLFALSSPQQVLLIRFSPGGEMLGAASVQVAFNLGNAIGAYCGGLPLQAGLSYRYPALLGTFFALVGFILLVLFSRKYETARQHV